jgi:hypothetical protein
MKKILKSFTAAFFLAAAALTGTTAQATDTAPAGEMKTNTLEKKSDEIHQLVKELGHSKRSKEKGCKKFCLQAYEEASPSKMDVCRHVCHKTKAYNDKKVKKARQEALEKTGASQKEELRDKEADMKQAEAITNVLKAHKEEAVKDVQDFFDLLNSVHDKTMQQGAVAH